MHTVTKKSIAALLIIAGLILVFMMAVIFRNYRSVMLEFAPEPAAEISQHADRTNIPNLQQISFQTRQGIHIAGWYAPSHNQAAIIITHGTNADRSTMLAETGILSNDGFGVLAIDWPGCGGSSGAVHWDADERDALESAVDWLTAHKGVNANEIGGLGFSMGAYTLAQVAATDSRIHAVVLEAAPSDFLEYIRWGHHHWAMISELGATLGLIQSHMPVKELRPIDVVKQISPRKLLIIGGDLDSVVPEFMTRELYKAAKPPASLWIIHGATHGGYMQAAPSQYPHRIDQFFEEGLLNKKPGLQNPSSNGISHG